MLQSPRKREKYRPRNGDTGEPEGAERVCRTFQRSHRKAERLGQDHTGYAEW